MNYQDINAKTIDLWCENGWQWGRAISHETYQKALNGEWDVLLTPTKPVPHDWFGDLDGKRLLDWQAEADSRSRSSQPLARNVRCWTIPTSSAGVKEKSLNGKGMMSK